jgi:hypothetical protein
MGQLKYFITYYNSMQIRFKTGLYPARRAAGATAPLPSLAKKI